MHSALLTADGALYVFGSDAHGQLGGVSSDGEPALVELPSEQDEDEDHPDVVSVACGSSHTALVTSDGGVWVAGQSKCSIESAALH